MAQSTFVIFAGAEQSSIGIDSGAGPKSIKLEVAKDASPAQIAATVSQSLKSASYRGQGVMLALPSSWCFAASISIGDLPRNDRKAMLYRFEEKLPLAAENVVADFCFHDGGAALGVCAKLAIIAPMIEKLEAEQIAVQSIVPAALLVAQGIAKEKSSCILLFPDESEQINLISLEDDAPRHWATVPAAGSDLEMQLQLVSSSLPTPPALKAIGLDAALVRELGQPVKERNENLLSLAMSAASGILSGRLRPWIELRRGALAIADPLRLVRRPLNAALAAGVALLLALSVTFLVRAHRYAVIEQETRRQLIEAFQERFPGWEVPANVRVIVESEHRKAALAAGAARPTQAPRSALQTMLDIMTRLPKEGRYSITQLSFAESSFELQGQARTNEQLDELVSAARAAGMEVQPPEARKKTEGYWNFTLRGTLPAKPDGQMAKGGA